MCQSCGMPIRKDNVKGSEKNGSLSETYCKLCYQYGKFIAPDCNLEQMQGVAIEGMREKGFPKFIAQHVAKKQLPKLGRWKNI